MRWLLRWLKKGEPELEFDGRPERNYPSLPTVKPSPDRPVSINPPRRSNFNRDSDWRAAEREHFRALADYNARKNIALGITHFRWRWAKAAPFPCRVGQRNDGQIFAFERPPAEGLRNVCGGNGGL